MNHIWAYQNNRARGTQPGGSHWLAWARDRHEREQKRRVIEEAEAIAAKAVKDWRKAEQIKAEQEARQRVLELQRAELRLEIERIRQLDAESKKAALDAKILQLESELLRQEAEELRQRLAMLARQEEEDMVSVVLMMMALQN